ncbi:MAG: hypothetical protein N2557_01190 [Hydrogenophilus sp.]|nr:hypothetical protein [Hydrogenophilus sp.]
MWRHDDQAATLRRLFRREPPMTHALYTVGKRWPTMATRFLERASQSFGRVLLADEATTSPTLPEMFGAKRPPDLLLALKEESGPNRFDLRLPKGWGYLNLKAAAVALPLLDETQRKRLFAAFAAHTRRYDAVILFAGGGSVADASWWLAAAPYQWLMVEVSGSGWRLALERARELARLGVDRVALVADGEEMEEANRFLSHLSQRVQRTISLPVWYATPWTGLSFSAALRRR